MILTRQEYLEFIASVIAAFEKDKDEKERGKQPSMQLEIIQEREKKTILPEE